MSMFTRFLGRFGDRTLEIGTVILVVLTVLVLMCYGTIFVNPWVALNPFPPPTTPVATVGIAVQATWTPSPTATSTNTPTATPTWTATATPTDTATPTATDTPLPPTATDTPPPPPTARPRPPKPTPVPTPFPYEYTISEGGPDCGATWVWGYVVGPEGFGEPNVQVRVGNDQGWLADTWTDVNGKYAYKFADGPKAGKWFVRVFKGGAPRSMQYWFQTSPGCEGPYALQQVHIDWRHR